MSIEAMKQALEALELHGKQYPHMQKGYTVDAITTLRTAIEVAEKQEPVKRWPFVETPEQFSNRLFEAIREFSSILPAVRHVLIENPPLNTTPPAAPVQELTCVCGAVWSGQELVETPAAQRKWVGLSEEEIDKLKHLIDWTATWSHGRFAYEIEQLLKEKNT